MQHPRYRYGYGYGFGFGYRTTIDRSKLIMEWEWRNRKDIGHNVFMAMPVTPLNEDTPQTNCSTSSDNTTSSSSSSSSSTSVCTNIERNLKNGDLYVGQWDKSRPHGHGKYLWKDGSMYEGEWFQGKTEGQGKFSWPSGATYVGAFKSGYMHGTGNFTGVTAGDTYIGQYSMNERSGKGMRTYVNGDSYDGEWKKGTQHGQGRYVWKNHHIFNGSWKNGKISGSGVLNWANGNSYNGEWEQGYPCGKGEYRWADGGYFVGVWTKQLGNNQQGIYHPPTSFASPQRDPQVDLRQALLSCKISQGETVPAFPTHKSIRWSDKFEELLSSNGSRTIRSTPNHINGKNATYAWEDNHNSSDVGRSGNNPWVPREIKKQGETISTNHKNYELMLNLQLGIRHAVGRPAPELKSLDLKASVFDPKEKVWTKFPTEGSKNTPPHASCEFKWKDYCPVVFRTLRKLMFKVDAADYMLSICGNDALRELSSPGKSGSFFYLTHDDRYMIKTVKKSEVKVLIKMLPAYYNHVRAFKDTLVTKFFGLHCVKLTGTTQKKVRFVIMGNLFCSEYPIHKRFDLKGSSYGRTTSKPSSEIDETTTLKDNDLNYVFRLRKSWFQDFLRQVNRDCDFLEQEKIMDYSLLVGLHFRDSNLVHYEGSSSETSYTSDGTPRRHRADMDQFVCDPNKWASIKLGMNMPAQVEQTMNRKSDYSNDELLSSPVGGGEVFDVVLFFGIIDILQDYDISKKLEHVYKSMQHDASSISAVDPKQYSRRFRDFILKKFSQDL